MTKNTDHQSVSKEEREDQQRLAEQYMRLDCLRISGGDVPKAEAMFAFVKGAVDQMLADAHRILSGEAQKGEKQDGENAVRIHR